VKYWLYLFLIKIVINIWYFNIYYGMKECDNDAFSNYMDEEIELPWMLQNNRFSLLVFKFKVATYTVSNVRSVADVWSADAWEVLSVDVSKVWSDNAGRCGVPTCGMCGLPTCVCGLILTDINWFLIKLNSNDFTLTHSFLFPSVKTYLI